MNEQEVWSVMHMSEVGGVALEDGLVVNLGDDEMMLGLFAFNDSEDVPPNAPEAVRAVRVGSTVVLYWTDTTADETSYYVQRGTRGFTPGAGARISGDLGANAETYVDSAPSATDKYYRIEVINAIGTTYSAEFHVKGRMANWKDWLF